MRTLWEARNKSQEVMPLIGFGAILACIVFLSTVFMAEAAEDCSVNAPYGSTCNGMIRRPAELPRSPAGTAPQAVPPPTTAAALPCPAQFKSRQEIANCITTVRNQIAQQQSVCEQYQANMGAVGTTAAPAPGQNHAFASCVDANRRGVAFLDCVSRGILQPGTQFNPLVSQCRQSTGFVQGERLAATRTPEPRGNDLSYNAGANSPQAGQRAPQPPAQQGLAPSQSGISGGTQSPAGATPSTSVGQNSTPQGGARPSASPNAQGATSPVSGVSGNTGAMAPTGGAGTADRADASPSGGTASAAATPGGRAPNTPNTTSPSAGAPNVNTTAIATPEGPRASLTAPNAVSPTPSTIGTPNVNPSAAATPSGRQPSAPSTTSPSTGAPNVSTTAIAIPAGPQATLTTPSAVSPTPSTASTPNVNTSERPAAAGTAGPAANEQAMLPPSMQNPLTNADTQYLQGITTDTEEFFSDALAEWDRLKRESLASLQSMEAVSEPQATSLVVGPSMPISDECRALMDKFLENGEAKNGTAATENYEQLKAKCDKELSQAAQAAQAKMPERKMGALSRSLFSRAMTAQPGTVSPPPSYVPSYDTTSAGIYDIGEILDFAIAITGMATSMYALSHSRRGYSAPSYNASPSYAPAAQPTRNLAEPTGVRSAPQPTRQPACQGISATACSAR